MARWVLTIGVTLATAGILFAVILAILATGPLRVDGPFFPLQEFAEEIRASVSSNPSSRVDFRLEVLDRRGQGVASLAGTDYEFLAVEALDRSLNHLLQDLASLSLEKRQTLRITLLTKLDEVEGVASALQYFSTEYPTESQVFFTKVSQFRHLVEFGPPTSAALLNLSQISLFFPIPEESLPAVVATSAPSFIHSFPLVGRHAELSCIQCHSGIGGAAVASSSSCINCHADRIPENHFSGECSTCHTPVNWAEAVFDHVSQKAVECSSCHLTDIPAGHVVSEAQCSSCHNTTAWTQVIFNHSVVDAKDCLTCHASQRSGTHISTDAQCSVCHSTNAWTPAVVNHEAAGLINCVSCHASKPLGHLETNTQCAACHSTKAWKPAAVNHAAAGLTNCSSCHSGNKPANHFQTVAQCSACHITTGWLPATFNHTLIGATDCQSCHAKPGGHLQTSEQCSSCHDTSAWKPARFSHNRFPLDHGGANNQCSTCHPSSLPNYSCTACHSTSYLENKHDRPMDRIGDCMTCHLNGNKPDD